MTGLQASSRPLLQESGRVKYSPIRAQRQGEGPCQVMVLCDCSVLGPLITLTTLGQSLIPGAHLRWHQGTLQKFHSCIILAGFSAISIYHILCPLLNLYMPLYSETGPLCSCRCLYLRAYSVCVLLSLTASCIRVMQATAAHTEVRFVVLSWRRMLLFSSTPRMLTQRRPKSCLCTLRGLN